jgi:hypothetical protein
MRSLRSLSPTCNNEWARRDLNTGPHDVCLPAKIKDFWGPRACALRISVVCSRCLSFALLQRLTRLSYGPDEKSASDQIRTGDRAVSTAFAQKCYISGALALLVLRVTAASSTAKLRRQSVSSFEDDTFLNSLWLKIKFYL